MPLASAPPSPSADTPDWRREACAWYAWDPGRQVLRCVRGYQRARQLGWLGRLWSKLWVLRYRFWSAVAGCAVPLNGERIGGGLMLPHPNGVVIHPEAVLGPNCMLFQQVTIGAGRRPGLPRLGGHVDVGAGAKLLGGITIGDHAIIGANAVVVSDVPPGATAVGIPARILPPRKLDDAGQRDPSSAPPIEPPSPKVGPS